MLKDKQHYQKLFANGDAWSLAIQLINDVASSDLTWDEKTKEIEIIKEVAKVHGVGVQDTEWRE